jgi:L-asparagine transporter-like permease
MTVRAAARGWLAFLAWLVLGLAGAFAAGVFVQVQNVSGPDWLFLLAAPLMLAVWAAIAVGFALGRARRLLASVVLAALLTSLVFMVGILGTFFPFAAGLDDRHLRQYGGSDYTWGNWLRVMLASSGAGGAAFGAFGGFLSWAFRPQPQSR